MFLPQEVNTKLENADGNYIADFETSASPKFQNRQKFGTKCALISIRKTMAKRGNEVERNEAARSCKGASRVEQPGKKYCQKLKKEQASSDALATFSKTTKGRKVLMSARSSWVEGAFICHNGV